MTIRYRHDPVLHKLSTTNRFDSDWPTLRQHLLLRLQSTLQVYLDKGPPRSAVRPASPAVPGPSLVSPSSATASTSGTAEDKDKPPPESLLLSPSNQTTSLESRTPGNPTGLVEPQSIGVEPSDSPAQSLDADQDGPDLEASTQGGLVIPPFPPLDTSKRKRSHPGGVKVNGHANGTFGRGQQGQLPPGEEEWDEDILIGGKKLPGWLDEEAAKREIERVGNILEGIEYAPFSVQRIAELLLDPTKTHSTLGKFLRALEKSLLVTTPWEAPSYVYVPPTTTTGAGMFSARSTSSASSGVSDAGSDEESLMPPGASTPMFSPIPFLRRPDTDASGSMGMDVDAPEGNTSRLDEGLMSPLVLGDGPSNGGGDSEPFRFADAPSIRSPTPEPDDSSPSKATSPTDRKSSTSPTSPTTTKAASTSPTTPSPAAGSANTTPTAQQSSDPAHQAYLGRVDELDTGPLTTPPTSSNGSADGVRGAREEDMMTPGTGEGGNMMPHGMSERPVPISSTTVVGDEERKIAGMPRAVGGEGGKLDGEWEGKESGEGEGQGA